jgi:Phosphotransferase enzyme family
MPKSPAAGERAPQPGVDYLDEVLRSLWPAPSVVRHGHRRGPVPPGVKELVVLPNVRQPKLVVPSRPRAATATAVRNSRSTGSARTALALRAAAFTARIGLTDLLGDRIVVEPVGRSSIVDHLTEQLGREVLVSLLIGPVRATQKPVLQVLRPDGSTVGFAKVGLTPVAQALVRREGEVLAELGRRGFRAVRVPRVLYRGPWRDTEILVQEAFPQRRGMPIRQDRLAAAMVEVARSGGAEEQALVGTAFWRRLRDLLLTWDRDDPVSVTLASAVLRTEAARGSQRLPMGCWHGDWAPWNMTVSGGEALVWDWETFTSGVPVGFDRVHFGLQSAVVLGDVPAAVAIGRVADRSGIELAPFGVPVTASRLVVLLYLLHLIAGFRETGEKDSRLARLETWAPTVLPALTSQVVTEGTATAVERCP